AIRHKLFELRAVIGACRLALICKKLDNAQPSLLAECSGFRFLHRERLIGRCLLSGGDADVYDSPFGHWRYTPFLSPRTFLALPLYGFQSTRSLLLSP